jgi:hypothetical protein
MLKALTLALLAATVTLPTGPLRIVGGPPAEVSSPGIRYLEMNGVPLDRYEPTVTVRLKQTGEPAEPGTAVVILDSTVHVPIDPHGDAVQLFVPMDGFERPIKLTIFAEPVP